jgi:hypothetical protein
MNWLISKKIPYVEPSIKRKIMEKRQTNIPWLLKEYRPYMQDYPSSYDTPYEEKKRYPGTES